VQQTVSELISTREKKSICNNLATTIEKRNNKKEKYLPILATACFETGRKNEAREYYCSAAEMATRIHDYESALRYYNMMAKCIKGNNKERCFSLFVKIANIYQTTGEAQLAISYYKRAISAKSSHLAAAAHTGLGKAYITMGKYRQAYKYLIKGIDKMKYGTVEYIVAANRLGYVLLNLLRFDDAEKLFDDSLHLAMNIGNKEAEADTMYHIAITEWYRFNFTKGIEKANELLVFCRKHLLLKQYAFCSSLLGSLHQQVKNIPLAQGHLDEAIKIFTEIKRADGLSATLHNSGLLLTQQGEFDSAQDLFTKSLRIAECSNNKSIQLASIINSALIYTDLGEYKRAIELYEQALRIEANNVWANYGLAMTLFQRNEISKARKILLKRNRENSETLYAIGLALISLAHPRIASMNELPEEDLLKLFNNPNTDISMRVEVLIRAVQFYQAKKSSEKVLFFSRKIQEFTHPLSREYNVASALIKITAFELKQREDIDIDMETARLKKISCLIDYAYLRKLRIDVLIDSGAAQLDAKKCIEELSCIKEILESFHADLMLTQFRDLIYRLFPFVVADYSRRVISEQYLQTFSGIAELISSDLGDEHFVQNILDLVIKATNAERGALFVKTTKGMDFIAGRDMDQTTIKDASALSHTAIKQLEKGKILFTQDALADPAFNIKKSVMLNQIRSLLCIPLSVSDNVIGAIYLDSRITSGIFGPQDKDFLMTISKILASVIEKSIAFRSMSEENILLKANIIKEIGGGHLMGKSRAMKEIYRLIDSVAETNSPVLILGETGTGKGMIARLIHLRSQRKNKKFLSINCGTIPETLLESELFGHKKGAFTGAISDKKGLLEEGEGGTVFLDEITNTSLEFQGKLLEAIEEKIIRRVGETTTRNIDVRFLFATNKDLEIEVEDSRFRRDLFYRINVFKIEVPPLRDRASDIPLLAHFFLERYTTEMNKKIDGYAPEALQRLSEYFWPGNVRELQNVIERAVVLAKTNLITLQDIGFEKTKTAEVMPLKEIKKEAVIEALNLANWNITKAAKMLSIGRRSLHRYIKKFNIVNDSTISIGRKK
jgi:Nif-specific regulatory protein